MMITNQELGFQKRDSYSTNMDLRLRKAAMDGRTEDVRQLLGVQSETQNQPGRAYN